MPDIPAVGRRRGLGYDRRMTDGPDIALSGAAAFRHARACHDHLAGALGIRLYDSLRGRGFLADGAAGPDLTPAGEDFVTGFGIDLAALRRGRVRLCRDCLDCSGRRNHLGGSLGRALLARIGDLGWARRPAHGRAVLFSPAGERAFRDAFPVPALETSSSAP